MEIISQIISQQYCKAHPPNTYSELLAPDWHKQYDDWDKLKMLKNTVLYQSKDSMLLSLPEVDAPSNKPGVPVIMEPLFWWNLFFIRWMFRFVRFHWNCQSGVPIILEPTVCRATDLKYSWRAPLCSEINSKRGIPATRLNNKANPTEVPRPELLEFSPSD